MAQFDAASTLVMALVALGAFVFALSVVYSVLAVWSANRTRRQAEDVLSMAMIAALSRDGGLPAHLQAMREIRTLRGAPLPSSQTQPNAEVTPAKSGLVIKSPC